MLTVKKYLAGHESQCPSICVTCQDCSTVYRRSGAATSHSDVICLTAQLQQLHHTLQNTQNRLNQETELLQQVNQQLIQLQERNEQLEQQIQILDHTCEEHLRERSKQRLLCCKIDINIFQYEFFFHFGQILQIFHGMLDGISATLFTLAIVDDAMYLLHFDILEVSMSI